METQFSSLDEMLSDISTENERIATLAAIALASPCTRNAHLTFHALSMVLTRSSGQLPVSLLGTLSLSADRETVESLIGLFAHDIPQFREALIARIARIDDSSLVRVPWAEIRPYNAFYGLARTPIHDTAQRARLLAVLSAIHGDRRVEVSISAALLALSERMGLDDPALEAIRERGAQIRIVVREAADERVSAAASRLLD